MRLLQVRIRFLNRTKEEMLSVAQAKGIQTDKPYTERICWSGKESKDWELILEQEMEDGPIGS